MPNQLPRATRHVFVSEARNGFGLFAARDFTPRETIVRITGREYNWNVLWRRGGSFAANCFRFGPETYLDPEQGWGRYLNHSCTPNAALWFANDKLFLVAAGPIRTRAEIVIDYSTTIGDDDRWRMYCRCGTRRCRRVITRFGLLPADVKKSYLRRGLVADNILPTLD